MDIRKIALLSLILLLPLTIEAQKKRKRVVKKPVIEEPQEDPRITNMREMTQQILFIDSIVVDKDDILPHLRISSDAGSLTRTSDILGKQVRGHAFVNEMGNRRYFSLPDDSLRQQLYYSDLLGSDWSNAQPVRGISDHINETDYPFMLTDGITLYFAGKGDESIGGYDIFFTRYDSHNGCFLQPENIGMPFNSEANDYLYAIDEYNKIGFFVSDRRQPEGKACIYFFVPSETRKTYDAAIYTEQQIHSLAAINRIADTWGNGKERKAALARMKTMATPKHSISQVVSSQEAQLIINDGLTYYSPKDFRSKEAASHYQQLVKARQQLSQLHEQLEKARNYYHKADKTDKASLRREILQAEADETKLNERIRTLEKLSRNEENKLIN